MLFMEDTAYIKLIEEISLNAWPSHKIELYDGWLIRFSHNYTHRTNSVTQVGASSIPVEEKIAYCEKIYENYHTPSIFKISPLIGTSVDLPEEIIVQLQDRITDEWITALFRLNGTTNPTLRRIVPSMFKAIPKETIVASIEIDGRMVASGLGIMDREHVGLYAIYVDASCRHKGFARAICNAILEEARKKNATKAYLQVVQGNTYAKKLYTSLGFKDLYTYWFRVK